MGQIYGTDLQNGWEFGCLTTLLASRAGRNETRSQACCAGQAGRWNWREPRRPVQILHNDAVERRLALAPGKSVWQRTPRLVGRSRSRFPQPARCRSSVVEHSIGNGEVDSSILSGSTIFPCDFPSISRDLRGMSRRHSIAPVRPDRAVSTRTYREEVCQLAQL